MTRTQPPALARDYAAEYLAARTTVYRAATINGRGDAIAKSSRILAAADRAGVALDEITIDHAARVAANGGAPLRPAHVVDGTFTYHPITGVRIYQD